MTQGATAASREEAVFDAVIVCNGHYSQPRVPEIAGLDAFKGLTHSPTRPLHLFGEIPAFLLTMLRISRNRDAQPQLP